MFASNRWPLPHEYGQNRTIFALQISYYWIYLFVLEFFVVSGCHFWGFGICKAGYVEYDYATVASTLGI